MLRVCVHACVHACVCVHYNPEIALFGHMNYETEGVHTSHVVNLRCVGEWFFKFGLESRGKFWKNSKCWGDPVEHIASCAALSVLRFSCLISSHLLNPVLTVQWQKLHSGSDLSVNMSKNRRHSNRQSQSVCALSMDAQTFSGFPPPSWTDFIQFILHSLTYTHVY